ncbi:hypothetical protein UY3_15113 [Chelonia mydas]|uniref:Uncharacterized protein n=1 Tax=Chelonia mydas TaxID=8469 RepID=M7BHS9_CHEMY|nr:hypothetical protein UY3_15113 [Chelonia mydas]
MGAELDQVRRLAHTHTNRTGVDAVRLTFGEVPNKLSAVLLDALFWHGQGFHMPTWASTLLLRHMLGTNSQVFDESLKDRYLLSQCFQILLSHIAKQGESSPPALTMQSYEGLLDS